jgi:radical SAM superfamily enzyme YgiQ (UPF0313 family)
MPQRPEGTKDSGTAPRVLFVLYDNFKTERLGVQILSAIAREEGWERKLIILSSLSPAEARERALAFRPQVVASSAMTFEHLPLQEFNRSLKREGLSFVSIFGGPHYTFSPEEIEQDPDIDAVCRGEGEEAFRSFLSAVRAGNDYSRIEKLWVRRGSELVKNQLGGPIAELDRVPFPDREIIPLYGEGEQIFGRSLGLMFTRGCPHRCTYCFNAEWNRLFAGHRIIRHRSAENVLAELREVCARYKPDLVYFHDDDFTLLPRDLIREFCRRYRSEIGRPFYVQVRATGVDDELISLLQEAGLAVVGMGVECGDEEIARNVLERGKISNQDIVRAFRIFHAHGVKCFSQNLFALPVPNPLETDGKTIRLNIECRPTWAQCCIVVPYPKTPLFDYAVAHGYLEKDAFAHPERFPSVFTGTSFRYPDPSVARRLNNLHKFASIVIRFPRLLPPVKLLIRLPPNPVFQYLHFAWYGYWNTVGLWGTKLSWRLVRNGLAAVRDYLKRH